MSLHDLVERAGSFKAAFERLKADGADVEKQVQQTFENDRLFKYVGFEVEKIDEGVVQMSFPFSENITRWGGMVHGGVVTVALDNACGLAVMTVNQRKNQVTMELKVNFLEKLTEGPFHVVGRVIRSGRTAIVAEGEIRDSKDKLCAKGIGTWLASGS
ncbi:MAG: PaaI family thioesterase [Nitrososphaerales archaeon]